MVTSAKMLSSLARGLRAIVLPGRDRQLRNAQPAVHLMAVGRSVNSNFALLSIKYILTQSVLLLTIG